jgi:hypothetical protein
MAENAEDRREATGQFYSGARRVKQLLGTFPDGTRIPGGPYTLTQALVLVGTVVIGWWTRPLWGHDLLSDVILLGAVTLGAAVLAGKLPGGRVNPFRVISGALGLLVRPSSGTYRGRPMKTRYGKAAPRNRPLPASDGPQQTAEPATATTTPVRNFSSLDLLRADLGIDS